MIRHPSISVLIMFESADAGLLSLIAYLRSIPHIRLSVQPHLPRDLNSYDVVVSLNESQSDDAIDPLTQFVRSGGGWLMLVD